MKLLVALLLGLLVKNGYAQFSLQATLRPRSELRNGYKTLKSEVQTPAFTTSQQIKLSLLYAPQVATQKKL